MSDFSSYTPLHTCGHIKSVEIQEPKQTDFWGKIGWAADDRCFAGAVHGRCMADVLEGKIGKVHMALTIEVFGQVQAGGQGNPNLLVKQHVSWLEVARRAEFAALQPPHTRNEQMCIRPPATWPGQAYHGLDGEWRVTTLGICRKDSACTSSMAMRRRSGHGG